MLPTHCALESNIPWGAEWSFTLELGLTLALCSAAVSNICEFARN